MKPVCLVTGNAHKIAEFASMAGGVDWISHSLDVPELQGSPEQVAAAKCRAAAALYGGPVVTDDVSLCFAAFDYKLPGPYVKDFLTSMGAGGLVRILSAFEDKRAYAQCIYAFCEGPGAEPLLFSGQCHGEMVPPEGVSSFGALSYDTVFRADASGLRYAAMTMEEKNRISHRGLAAAKLMPFLVGRQAQ